jgi:hypothetical protein
MINEWMLEGSQLYPPSTVLEAEYDGWAGLPMLKRLRCPVCGDTYQHPLPPEVVRGEDRYGAGWGGRGDLFILPVWGECDHRWELCFGSHKGEMFCFVRVPYEREAAA